MRAKIIQEFKGEINDVKFINEQVYRTSEYLIENIENKFGEVSKNFVEDLKNTIEIAAYKYDTFDFKVSTLVSFSLKLLYFLFSKNSLL